MIAQAAPVGLGGQAAVLGPLDLGRKVARGPEPIGPRKRVSDLAQQERFRREDPAGPLASRAAQLRESSRVERPRLHALDAEPLEPGAHLGRGLVSERDGEDLVRPNRSRGDLPGDPPRDRRRLPRPSAREDAHWAAHSLGRPPLLGVEPAKDRLRVHRATLVSAADAPRSASAPRVCLLLPVSAE